MNKCTLNIQVSFPKVCHCLAHCTYQSHISLSVAACAWVSVDQPTAFPTVAVGTSTKLPCQVLADPCFLSSVIQIFVLQTLKGFNWVICLALSKWETIEENQRGSD